ncbi:conjugal transfer protein [Streptomyces sp. NPDC001606]
MTDQNSSAGAVGAGQPSGQPGSFGPPHAPQQAQAPQAAWPAQGQQAPQAQPQPMASDAARAQVAAAWVRSQPRAGQAAVPALPPRETTPRTESKKEKRERERAARKAAYEQKKAAKQERKNGGAKAPAAPAPVSAQAPAVTAPASVQTPAAPAPVSAQTPAVTAPAQAQPHAPAAQSAASPAPAQTTAPAASPAATPASPAAPSASAAPSADKSSATEAAAPAPARSFDVPKPGGRIPTGGSGGRRTHVALRATLLVTTCVLALGSCGVMGLMVGVSSRTNSAALDESDAARYRLTDFPLQQAASLAEQYALLCLTYSPEKDSERRAKLAQYASAGVDPECGWNGTGSSTAVSATWDGTVENLPEYGDHGRYLGVQVRTADGNLTELTVPVYVKDLASGEGMRVAGDVGQMPLPAHADVPEINQNHEVTDEKLADQLKSQVLPGYFTAWGASDATAMARFTAPGATLSATSGLAGRLSKPNVTQVVALVPPKLQGNDPYTYPTGQTVQLRVVVEWGDPNGQTARRAYRMTVVNTAQGWFIQDIRGGLLDPQGGRADDGSDSTDPSASPGATDSSDSSDSTGSTPSASGSPSPSGTTVQSTKGKRHSGH